MNWKKIFKPRTSNIISIFFTAIIIEIFAYLFTSIGGPNYFRFPFTIKQTSCGSWLDADKYCTYPLFPEGIILSIIFWIFIYVVASIIFYKKEKPDTNKQN